jgi:hypothetical protein
MLRSSAKNCASENVSTVFTPGTLATARTVLAGSVRRE